MLEKPSEKRAAIRLRQELFLVYPISIRSDGIWTDHGPVQTLDQDVSNDDLGNATIGALNMSRKDLLATPLRQAVPIPLFFADLGIRTWAAFDRGALLVTVAMIDISVEVTPWQKMGARQGFQPISEGVASTPADSTAEQIGAAIRNAFDVAK